MTARENILARIRARQGKPPAPGAEERAAVEGHIAARAPGPLPRVGDDPAAHFRERALALASTVDEVGSLEYVPRAVSAYLNRHSLPLAAVCWPQFAALDWNAHGVRSEARAATATDLVGITGAFCAIAETGTLVLVSGPRTPATVSLLPETHIAVVHVSRIVRNMEAAWALLRTEHSGGCPRAVTLVSGPSRTADVEQTVTLGAHGPYRVHIILIWRA
ncbi:MAG: lactate utilization protein C [Betaproteobacteria bacterium]|nr:lactate utilization protein C [Betaproteobacteria bacterium]